MSSEREISAFHIHKTYFLKLSRLNTRFYHLQVFVHKQRHQDSWFNGIGATHFALQLKTCPFMGLNLRDVSLCCVWIINVASFGVNVPERCLLAIRGRPAVLGCEFTPDPDLSSLVVTWQRQEDARVVHSFYYQQDKLDRQSPEYHNRTSLYISELGKGNASLRMHPVGPKDAGRYLCQVSNAKGTGKALIELDYGALYSEPRFNIHVNSTSVTVQFETEGFPKPEVIWLEEHNQNLSYHLEIQDQTEDGLFYIKSSCEVQKPVVNVTFTLRNHLLNQNLQRLVFLSNVSDEDGDGTTAIIILSILSVILFAVVMFLLLRKRIKPYI